MPNICICSDLFQRLVIKISSSNSNYKFHIEIQTKLTYYFNLNETNNYFATGINLSIIFNLKNNQILQTIALTGC